MDEASLGSRSAPRKHAARNASSKDRALPATIKVLIVDDHRGFRDALRDAINLSGNIRVIGEANSGEDCIDQVRRGLDVDLILMDVAMPGMSGIDATRQVMSIRPEVKVIAVTMYNQGRYREAAIAAGAKDLLLKGGSISDVEMAIEIVVHGEVGVRDLR